MSEQKTEIVAPSCGCLAGECQSAGSKGCYFGEAPQPEIVAILAHHRPWSGAVCRCGWAADRSVAFEAGRDVPTQHLTHVADLILTALATSSRPGQDRP